MTPVTELRLRGDLGAQGFVPWICHRARVLNLSGWVARVDAGAMIIVVAGPEALCDAMEVACSLGPADVIVEDITRRTTQIPDLPNGFHLREGSSDTA